MRCEPIEAPIGARPRTAGLACRVCGCTDDNACPGGCGWVSIDPPLCSACVGAEALADASADADIDANAFYGGERCPASATPASHVPLFTSETEWHCVNCQLAFFT